MEDHPSYPVLLPYFSKYPRAAGSLFQAYTDIVYSQQWLDTEVVDLERCGRAAIKGRRKNEETFSYVVPCALMENISFGWLKTALADLSSPPAIYLAITTDDSSIVYYKISDGIVKPTM
ncbi:hypothetical protein AMATHDRAFT_75093 [Amanita thiersii Skay4041]|uniref:tRNA-splicing endonuclease subunit Sen15 domain-containing protein n=1 Tax=Amanita thiersii Skay4041 TaxID=703135 RepID=A0A2A9NTZ6_9AGAR|nr:hypothetical protein AMATHDRAFT_75093 [Amanita thiersii Skay4041]